MHKALDISCITLQSSLPEPLYLQLANKLQAIISGNALNCTIKFPSQRDLSSRLGLDRSTVKRAYEVLADRGVIEYRGPYTVYSSPETRRKTLDLFPNIGIIIPHQFSWFIEFSGGKALRYFAGIIDCAAEKNIGTLMLQLPAADSPPEIVSQYLDNLNGRLLGVIHIGKRSIYPDFPLEKLLHDSRINQIVISALPTEVDIGAVVDNPEPGARALAEHLIQFGHRKVGIVVWNNTWEPPSKALYFTYASHARPQIFRDVFREYGLTFLEEHQLFACKNSSLVQERLAPLIQSRNLPDMFWCCNDVTAGWVIETLEKEGVKVPEDISVVGYDGCSSAPLFDRLTTISLPFYAIGVKAVEQLLEYQKNGLNKKNQLMKLQTSLILKKTLAHRGNDNSPGGA